MNGERTKTNRSSSKRPYVPPGVVSQSSKGLAPLLMATPPGPDTRCCDPADDFLAGCPLSGPYVTGCP